MRPFHTCCQVDICVHPFPHCKTGHLRDWAFKVPGCYELFPLVLHKTAKYPPVGSIVSVSSGLQQQTCLASAVRGCWSAVARRGGAWLHESSHSQTGLTSAHIPLSKASHASKPEVWAGPCPPPRAGLLCPSAVDIVSTFRPCGGAVLCISGHLAASLASTR